MPSGTRSLKGLQSWHGSFLVCNPVTSMYASLGVKPELICEQDKQLLERGHLPPIVSCVDRWPWSACCASTLPREGLQQGRVAHQIAGSFVVLVHLRSHRSNRQTVNLQQAEQARR